MTRVLIVGCIEFAVEEYERLRTQYRIDYCTSRTRDQFIGDCRTLYKDVTIIYRTCESQEQYGVFDKTMIAALPSTVKYILQCSSGYDDIDIGECTKRNIMVSHTPSAVDDATADITVSLLLNCSRNILAGHDNVRAGRWKYGVRMGTDIQNKVLGIVGAGGIGRTVAKRMAGFDMKKIQYYNRTRLSDKVEKQYGLVYVDFDTLLKTSDIISVHCPLNEETYHLLSYKEFAAMKDNVIIINTSRGKVVHEIALVNALERGKVLSAGLDVFEEEPKISPGLLSHPRCVLLPHMGTFTNESSYKMEKLVLDNMISAIEHQTLLTPVVEHRKFFK